MKIPSGSARDKTRKTRKNNKYNNPLYARKIFFQLLQRMSAISAKGVITKRRRKK
jgi:hypothetical protein